MSGKVCVYLEIKELHSSMKINGHEDESLGNWGHSGIKWLTSGAVEVGRALACLHLRAGVILKISTVKKNGTSLPAMEMIWSAQWSSGACILCINLPRIPVVVWYEQDGSNGHGRGRPSLEQDLDGGNSVCKAVMVSALVEWESLIAMATKFPVWWWPLWWLADGQNCLLVSGTWGT